jgi:hypothetical protein
LTGSIWDVLGLDPTDDEREIRRAYARRLKTVHPEDDPEGFQALRSAHDQAMDMARRGFARGSRGGARTSAAQAPDSPAPAVESEPEPPARSRQARPALSDDLRAELEARRGHEVEHARLRDALVRRINAPEPNAEATLAALLALLRSPAMAALHVHERTEAWLSELIGNSGDSVDVLVEPAIAFFGWSHDNLGYGYAGHAVLARRDSLEAVRSFTQPGHRLNPAYRALSGRIYNLRLLGFRLTFGLRRQVQELFESYDVDYGPLANRLDGEAVAWWRRHLAGPSVGPGTWWLLIVAPILAAFFATRAEDASVDVLTGVAIWLGVLGLGSLGVLALRHLILKPRWAWIHEGGLWRATDWQRLGWAPISLGLLLVSSLAGYPAFVGVCATVAVVMAGWSWVVVPPRPPEMLTSLVVRTLVRHFALVFYLLITVASLGPAGGGLRFVAPAALAAFAIGLPELEGIWARQSRNRQRLVAAVLVVASIALYGLMPQVTTIEPLGLGVAAVTILCLFAGPISAAIPSLLRRGLLLLQLVATVASIGTVPGSEPITGHPSVVIMASKWMLIAVIVTALAAITPRVRLPGSKRRKGVDRFG